MNTQGHTIKAFIHWLRIVVVRPIGYMETREGRGRRKKEKGREGREGKRGKRGERGGKGEKREKRGKRKGKKDIRAFTMSKYDKKIAPKLQLLQSPTIHRFLQTIGGINRLEGRDVSDILHNWLEKIPNLKWCQGVAIALEAITRAHKSHDWFNGRLIDPSDAHVPNHRKRHVFRVSRTHPEELQADCYPRANQPSRRTLLRPISCSVRQADTLIYR